MRPAAESAAGSVRGPQARCTYLSAPLCHAHLFSPAHSSPPQGLGATILRNTPANAVYLGTFEVLKRAASARMGVAPTELPAW